MSSQEKVAVLGSGLIGRSFAMIFASGGYQVALYDIEKDQVEKARLDIEEQLKVLEIQGLLRGSLGRQQQLDLITGVSDLREAVKDALFVQECVPERLDIKRSLWAEVDPLITRNDVILSSSTSALLPSSIAEGMAHKERFVVSHPTNPPFYAPLIEVIPSQWTVPEVVTRTLDLLSVVGQVPVLVKKEVDGFVLNRIQLAILGESWRLVRTNPPFYAPLVEVVPSQWTLPEVVSRTTDLLSGLGQVSVLVKKEVDGFVLNRLQYAIMGEAWRLVRDGVISADDLDKVMSSGLGTRYAFVGPWETAYLNAEGLDSYVERYAEMIYRVQRDQGPPEKMTAGPTLEAIKAAMEKIAGPLQDIHKRRQWRDRHLAALAKLKVDTAAADQLLAAEPGE